MLWANEGVRREVGAKGEEERTGKVPHVDGDDELLVAEVRNSVEVVRHGEESWWEERTETELRI
jgi:hypothetical protein